MRHESITIGSFGELKKAVEKKHKCAGAKTPSPEKAKPVPKETKTDEELFAEAMSDVKAIENFRLLKPKPSPRIRVERQSPGNPASALAEAVSGRDCICLSDTDEYIEWAAKDAGYNICARLHEGRFAIGDTMDLHGHTGEEAEAALEAFVKDARMRGLRCVKVIHGRGLRSPGAPVVKQAVRRLLDGKMRKWILAYATVRRADGGLGATYVLLKKHA